MESSTRDAREARQARARLYGATVTFVDKKRLAETLVSCLGGADGAPRAGDGHAATHGLATAAVLCEWALATLAWAGLAADISDRGPRGGGSAGSGARGGSGGGGASKKLLQSKPTAPPPKAVGGAAPDAASICADADVWHVLMNALDATDESRFASASSAHKPNATAATHVVRAAAAAAAAELSHEDAESLFSLVAACLSRLERRLGAAFKPNVGQSVGFLRACVQGTRVLGDADGDDVERRNGTNETKDETSESRSVLADAAFRLWSRSLRASPHRAPAAPPRDTIEATLRRAARDRSELTSRRGRSAVESEAGGSRVSSRAGGKPAPALDALAAVLFHPCHREHVPAAFAAAAATVAREDAAREGAGKRSLRLGVKTADAKRKRSGGDGDDGGAGDEDANDAPRDGRFSEPPRIPETVRLIASRVLAEARAGEAVGALAPWIFRTFAEGETSRAAGSGARGNVASTSGEAAASATRREAPSRALWDALFVPIARSNVTCASDLIGELGRARLYSQTAAEGGPAPPGGAAPRDRLEAFAASVFGGRTRATRGVPVASAAPAKALRALVETDLRLVDPHLSEALAATWSADAETEEASETVAAAVAAHAATRRIPEFLAAVGSAAASLAATNASASGFGCARVFATPAVLAAAAAAGARVPPGQTAAVIAAARDAASAAFVEPATEAEKGSKRAKRPSSSRPGAAAAERAAATCTFVATIVCSLPAVPGEPLAAGARVALEGFARDLVDLVRAGGDAAEARRAGGDGDADGDALGRRSAEKEKKRKRARSGSDAAPLENLGDVSERERERDAIDAARLGAALVAYVPVAAMLETCHDGEELHDRSAAPYLCAGPVDSARLAPSLVRVAATVLRLRGDVGEREVGAGVAGACVHRIAQLARSAAPPPAGRGDANAATEARALAEVLTHPGALATASAVDALRSAEDVWTPWAEPAQVEAWVRARGEGPADMEEPEVLAARVFAASRGRRARGRRLDRVVAALTSVLVRGERRGDSRPVFDAERRLRGGRVARDARVGAGALGVRSRRARGARRGSRRARARRGGIGLRGPAGRRPRVDARFV